MDTRGSRQIRALCRGPISIAGYAPGKVLTWLRLTGGAPGHSGKDSLAHILHMKEEAPEVYAAADKLLEPKDYLNFLLTGRMAASYDSIVLHWVTDNRDLERVAYHPALLRLAGIDRGKLPDLLPATAVLGTLRPEVATELGLPESAQVVMGTPDLQGAAIGSGAVRDYEGHLYVGTSSWITCHVPFKKTDLGNNLASLPSPIPRRYFVANDQEAAGACLHFLRDRIFWHDDAARTAEPPPDTFQLFDRIAAAVPPGSDKVIFTPWLVGERTPVEDPHVRGAFFNLGMQSSRPHMIRAVLEGVAYNARWLLGAVERFIGRDLPSLRYIGGGAQSELWCQIMADVLDRPIDQVENPVAASVRGAALLAAAALGHLSFDDLGSRVPVARRFEPDPANRAIYDELFEAFVEIYRANKKIYARLNGGRR
jgi:xylulokinase